MTSRVLVVGSNGESMHGVRSALEARGLAVQSASDGPSALASLELQRPDVILLEVDMPEMTGMEVLDRIRANPQQTGIPVILMSGHPDMMERVPGIARRCIQKPFSLTALLATIESAVEPGVA